MDCRFFNTQQFSLSVVRTDGILGPESISYPMSQAYYTRVGVESKGLNYSRGVL